MNPDHDMLADRLRGHVYKMSRWQYMAAREQMDPELQYVALETVHVFRNDPKNFDSKRCYRPWDLISAVTRAVANLLSDRLSPGKSYVNIAATVDYVMKSYRKLTNFNFEIMDDIVETMLIYIVHDVITQIQSHAIYDAITDDSKSRY